MRRMYSKEQLQKLIDEVSRLIAIEELDKVVPVPSAADNGKIIQVNPTGTGYQLAAIGDLTKAYIENIYDSKNHNRFIEDDLEVNQYLESIVTYAKWSLSGTHLLIVLAGQVLEDTTIDLNTILASAVLPSWILEKIYQLTEQGKVASAMINGYTSFYTTALKPASLVKDSDRLNIQMWGEGVTIPTGSFRVAFDLLIDND